MAKILKDSDVGDRMNLWYRRCNFNTPTLKNWSNTQYFSKILCRNFISFLTSIRSSKTEFGAKRYGQNTEWHMEAHDDPTLHKITPSVHPTVYLN
jgi:hypothetical protein